MIYYRKTLFGSRPKLTAVQPVIATNYSGYIDLRGEIGRLVAFNLKILGDQEYQRTSTDDHAYWAEEDKEEAANSFKELGSNEEINRYVNDVLLM